VAGRAGDDGTVDSNAVAARLANLGFLADSDLPDTPGPATLLVALRRRPTLRHYDPELVEFWVTEQGRGRRTTLTKDSRLPMDGDFSWGLIRIVDRLLVSNEYLTFGGHVSAVSVEDETYVVFTSPAPLLRRGGHSQGFDVGSKDLGAYFGRIMVAIDYTAGFEGRMAEATPVERYAAFVADVTDRYRGSPQLRTAHADLWRSLQVEETRLRTTAAETWAAGLDLRAAAAVAR
jgi:hypothetical protein